MTNGGFCRKISITKDAPRLPAFDVASASYLARTFVCERATPDTPLSEPPTAFSTPVALPMGGSYSRSPNFIPMVGLSILIHALVVSFLLAAFFLLKFLGLISRCWTRWPCAIARLNSSW